MAEQSSQPKGPDLAQGVKSSDLAEGAMLSGHVGEKAVMLARQGGEAFALGAHCTHYGGPLARGLLVEGGVRCPWHHACFSLRTGEDLRAPARDPVDCFEVEERDGLIRVLGKRPQAGARQRGRPDWPPSVLIIGGGAAGEIAAETLRQEGYGGAVTILSADEAPPCDRPNLSKDYLAGDAPEDWLPLRGEDWYRDNGVELRLGCEVAAIQPERHEVTLADGSVLGYGALLLATGSEPVRLKIPGADRPHVRYLRSLADCKAIIERAAKGARAVVLGASFIGLEVAASLRKRGLEVDVVAPDSLPLERILGPEIGRRIAGLHEAHGVRFHLGLTAASIEDGAVVLSNGERIPAELVVAGIGVRPRTALAEAAGLKVDNGIVVDSRLRTNAPDVWAAGDIARWPDPHTGQDIRVEHWVLAQRQGQAAARNILGADEAFEAAPFFWSAHYDMAVHYVGHAQRWDRTEIDGDVAAGDCRVSYFEGARLLAVAAIGRDLESLKAEVTLERQRA